jgi:hypothetical protein
MLRVNAMRYFRTHPRWRGDRCAAVLAAAVVLSACSHAATPDPAGTGTPSRFSSLFSGAAGASVPAAAGNGAAFNGVDCPNVDIRNGAGLLTINSKPPDAAGVRYQLNFTDVARQCTVVGSDLVMKVGVQGRIIVGAAGGPGPVDIPLRYAVVREGADVRTLATKFKRIAVEVPPGQANVVFSDVEESLSFPIPSRADLPGYMVYVGFDEIGDAPEKKPAPKKPAPKRKDAAREIGTPG